MSVAPIKIPQNVYIEDRIVGPLTLKQVLIVAVGGGFSYSLFALLSKTYGGLSLPVTIMVWIPCAISAIFAFVKINDLSMLRLIMLLLETANKPAQRVWTPRTGIVINIRTRAVNESEGAQQSQPQQANSPAPSKLDELSALLDLPQRASEAENASLPEESDDTAASPAPTVSVLDTDRAQMESTPQRPVDQSRIQVSPMDASTSIDTVRPAQSVVSVFATPQQS